MYNLRRKNGEELQYWTEVQNKTEELLHKEVLLCTEVLHCKGSYKEMLHVVLNQCGEVHMGHGN